MPSIAEIRYLGRWEEVNPENDNIDVLVRLDDGRVFSFVVATPNNIFWCMANEGIDYYFGNPPVFVRLLNKECVEKAMAAILTEDNGRWLDVYGTLQEANT
jgi:uncharacterized membrane protein YpjA